MTIEGGGNHGKKVEESSFELKILCYILGSIYTPRLGKFPKSQIIVVYNGERKRNDKGRNLKEKSD